MHWYLRWQQAAGCGRAHFRATSWLGNPAWSFHLQVCKEVARSGSRCTCPRMQAKLRNAVSVMQEGLVERDTEVRAHAGMQHAAYGACTHSSMCIAVDATHAACAWLASWRLLQLYLAALADAAMPPSPCPETPSSWPVMLHHICTNLERYVSYAYIYICQPLVGLSCSLVNQQPLWR